MRESKASLRAEGHKPRAREAPPPSSLPSPTNLTHDRDLVDYAPLEELMEGVDKQEQADVGADVPDGPSSNRLPEILISTPSSADTRDDGAADDTVEMSGPYDDSKRQCDGLTKEASDCLTRLDRVESALRKHSAQFAATESLFDRPSRAELATDVAVRPDERD